MHPFSFFCFAFFWLQITSVILEGSSGAIGMSQGPKVRGKGGGMIEAKICRRVHNEDFRTFVGHNPFFFFTKEYEATI